MTEETMTPLRRRVRQPTQSHSTRMRRDKRSQRGLRSGCTKRPGPATPATALAAVKDKALGGNMRSLCLVSTSG